MKKYYFTSEAVTEGHPDKICDRISDKILDTALKEDKNSIMAVEVTIKDELIFIYGEANTKARINYEKIALDVISDIGYTEEYKVLVKVGEQSSEINNAVVKDEVMAGDQGIMFGYACMETEELMPYPIVLANRLAKRLTDVRKNDLNTILKPDGKTQVTVEYVDGKVNRIDTIIVSSQHKEGISYDKIYAYIKNNVIDWVVDDKLIDKNTKFLINTSGSFVVGGSFGDSGTTGRKIICDTYGGMARIGGGCLSSKDPSKVDRSAAYYARYVAKNIVHYNLCERCEIQVSYAIGMADPISIYIDCFGTEKVNMDEIYLFVKNNFNFRVSNIIDELDLLNVSYFDVACYGHFGRSDLDLPWEKIKNI